MNLTLSLLLLLPAAPRIEPSAAPAPAVRFAVESVDELITAGRAHLAAGRAAEALASFEAAAEIDPSFKTRQWILRTWIDQARVNDALNAIDALAKAGEQGPAVDYLYGMAFSQKAKGYIVEGVSGGIIAMAFGDAVEFLKKATSADPRLYADAFLPLAESAWYAGDLETARAAAEKATELLPRDGDTWQMLGRIAFSQYSSVREDPEQAAAADAAWSAAKSAFTTAAQRYGASEDAAVRARGAESLTQLGWLNVWKQQGDAAAADFAGAIAIAPAAVDYGQLQGSLTPEQFVSALESAATTYETLHGKETADDAILQWWLGVAQYNAKRYAEAEAALARAVAKAPAFTNAWYYIALSRYFRQDYDGTIAALRTHYGLSADDAIASLMANATENLGILDYMISLKAARAANLDAAFLAELQTRMAPDNDRFWNNLGLFLRDEGEGRERRKKSVTPEEHKQILDLYERSYAAYVKSLELSPNDPNYLNDAALMLHYHLDRDLDQARAWYVKAAEMAQIELAKPTLSRADRPLREMALRDAKNNLADLDAILEKRRKAAEKARAEAEKPAPPTPPKPQ